MTTLTVRIISQTEQRADILNDDLFKALQNASRAEIEAYLNAQIADVNTRVVLSLLMRGVRYLVSQVRT
jgi:hypothetical protein